MKNKRVFGASLIVVLCMMMALSVTTTSYARSNEEEDGHIIYDTNTPFVGPMDPSTVPVIIPGGTTNTGSTQSGGNQNNTGTTNQTIPQAGTETQNTPSGSGGILTPSGNLTLVDDVEETGEKNVQYMTVQTRNGEYFYMIVDKTGNTENVYFLNMVDERDLKAILSEEEEEIIEEEKPIIPEIEINPEIEEEPSKEPEKARVSFLPLIFFLIIGIGVVAGYYFLKIKPGKEAKGSEDEFDFEDDEDYEDDGEPDEYDDGPPWDEDDTDDGNSN